ncbi:MAG TPA: DinB family protein [Vicinamibacteria bacterium]|nr:DinB family protein [Vicinamibacteria bacterium]
MDERQLRSDVVELLRGGSAHATWEKALAGLAPAHRAASPGRGLHTIWQLVEHVRIAQEDILRYAIDPGWRSPKWPAGYWPSIGEPTPKQWKASLAAFRRDLEAVVAMVLDPNVDLTAAIPHGEGGHTYLREALLVADHNAHHLGQVIQARRLLGGWK